MLRFFLLATVVAAKKAPRHPFDTLAVADHYNNLVPDGGGGHDAGDMRKRARAAEAAFATPVATALQHHAAGRVPEARHLLDLALVKSRGVSRAHCRRIRCRRGTGPHELDAVRVARQRFAGPSTPQIRSQRLCIRG